MNKVISTRDKIPGKQRLTWMLLLLLLLISACQEPVRQYLKARTPEELKTSAYELCGRDYKVLSYEDDTGLVECLPPLGENCIQSLKRLPFISSRSNRRYTWKP